MKRAYKILRNVIFSLMLTLAGLYVILYICLSIPSVQNWIKELVQEEFNSRSSGRLAIDKASISPFSEVVLSGVNFIDAKGDTVVKAATVGAGIDIWQLVLHRHIELTYAEVIGLDAHVKQAAPGAPLNIQFIIDGFKSKKQDNKPTRVDLTLNNVVIRRGNLTFDKEWQPRRNPDNRVDFNHLSVRNLAADLRFPVLKNDDILVDLRRLAFTESHGLTLESLSGRVHVTPQGLSFQGLTLRLPGTKLAINDMELSYNGFDSIVPALKRAPIHLQLTDNLVTPYDFRAFVPVLKNFGAQMRLSVDALRIGDDIQLNSLRLTQDRDLLLDISGSALNVINHPVEDMVVEVPNISFKATGHQIERCIAPFLDSNPALKALIGRCGDVSLDATLALAKAKARFKGNISTAVGDIDIDAEALGVGTEEQDLQLNFDTDDFNLGLLTDNSDFGHFSAELESQISKKGKDISGHLQASVPFFNYKGYNYTDLSLDLEKHDKDFTASIESLDDNLTFNIDAEGALNGKASYLNLDADLANINLSQLQLPKVPVFDLSAQVSARLRGDNIDNLHGNLTVDGLHYSDVKNGDFNLNYLTLDIDRETLPNTLDLDCDFLQANLTGKFMFSKLPAVVQGIFHKVLPDLVAAPSGDISAFAAEQEFDYSLLVRKDAAILNRVKLPVILLEDLQLTGRVDGADGVATLNMDVPYLQQGQNKLIRDTKLALTVDNSADICNLYLTSRMPNSKGYTTLMVDANAHAGKVDTDIAWLFDRVQAYRGNVSLSALLSKNAEGKLQASVDVNRSTFEVNDTTWVVNPGRIDYSPGSLTVSDVKVHRPGQYVALSGMNKIDSDETIDIDLKDIDLGYIFDTLKINYVVFGGVATGKIQVADILSKQPRLFTDGLNVEQFTYNNSLLGDAVIKSRWIDTDKSVKIDAKVKDGGETVADIDGQIWVTRDSLNFDFDASRLNIGFLKPFMAAFTDDVKGRASGHAKLYGTFKDIDLVGKIFADEIKLKIGLTNTEYTASDTVTLTPGRINLNNITLYDRERHTAKLNGYVTHEYFHNPAFKFTISDAKDFLCYDTNNKINPDWYGTIYANGSGTITGVPGFIDILVDMTTAPRSVFTLVLDDKEVAEEYQFLTFTDRRKEALEAERKAQEPAIDAEPEFVQRFVKKVEQNADLPSKYKMDLRVTTTPDAQAVIVMDPVGGDKIRAYGSGPLRFTYNSEGEMSLYGTYTIDRGSYNFTLQEIIVRDFKINEGSKITFTGDPFAANLDIVAAYRVNASLTDLDASFAHDADLNRNNVPVEALLKVSGDMRSPDIGFDIGLPTLNQDAARKVKSIVSTADMMSMQIVYLLALNRFYTPDYMNNSRNNNEMASLASATVSTQLSSILGQLSDNWSFAPSFHTDKGDFSDMEVDLALSSTLLNNRLLLNGNLGYRDRATSSTTFIGDFDIEYLLNRQGTIRLKAYNHYNDQNYYLRSALTTQGVGIVFKRDFNRFLPGLFRRKKATVITAPQEPADSLK